MVTDGVQWGLMGTNGVPLRHTHVTLGLPLPLGFQWLLWPPVGPLVHW
jgi:hypothetical protein